MPGILSDASKVLVINSGSSSLKYKLFDAVRQGTLAVLASGLVERIGEAKSIFNFQVRTAELCTFADIRCSAVPGPLLTTLPLPPFCTKVGDIQLIALHSIKTYVLTCREERENLDLGD